MASFLTYLKKNKMPKKEVFAELGAHPRSRLSIALYSIGALLVLAVYFFVASILDTFLITAPRSGGTLTEGIIGSPLAAGLIGQDANVFSGGPFVLENKSSTESQTISLQRDRHYTLDRPYLRKISVASFANQDQLTQALRDGEIDYTFALDAAHAALFTSKAFTTDKIVTSTDIAVLRLPNDLLLADQKFISILDHYIDKTRIVATVESGYGTLAQSATPLSTAETLESLNKLGYLYTDGTLIKRVSKKEVQQVGFAVAVENDEHLLASARMLAEELGKLGIIVTVKAYDHGTFVDGISRGEYSIILGETLPTLPSQYQKVFALYTKVIPYVANRKAHIPLTIELASPTTRYMTSASWYTNTQKIWKMFINKK